MLAAQEKHEHDFRHDFHRRRDPFASPFWRIVDAHYDVFERVYPERYAPKYGFLRPALRVVVDKFVKCGDLREGFARVRCDDCGHDLFVSFSCKTRCFCPSCHQKRILELSLHVREDVFATVPHRQFVFTIPKRLRIYFRFNRELLGHLPAIAFDLIREVYQAALGRVDAVPGMVAAVQTFGELAHWHPHVHAIVTDGAFAPDGRFAALPKLAVEPFLKLWEHQVFKLLLDAGRISAETVEQMRAWQHSGFSVDRSVFIKAGDGAALERLVQYIARCPFSLDRILQITPTGQVVYKAEHDGCRKFPEPTSGTLKAGINRNFQIFDPLDFLAEVTQHIPDIGEHTVRYYGWYSNKSRGMRAKAAGGEPDAVSVDLGEADALFRKACRSRWAAMIKRVYETDPLVCPRCGGQMRIVAFIERRTQADVIEKILRHCGLWVEPGPRAPPKFTLAAELEPEYIPIDEFLANF
jgi:hypothetical protein